jgi:hypothetical protein
MLVITKHFPKWIELASLINKSSEGVAYAYLKQVLSKLGLLAKVFTNQIMEFKKEFQELCEQALIDHKNISHDKHKANGFI